jgi:hypothetical protein
MDTRECKEREGGSSRRGSDEEWRKRVGDEGMRD